MLVGPASLWGSEGSVFLGRGSNNPTGRIRNESARSSGANINAYNVAFHASVGPHSFCIFALPACRHKFCPRLEEELHRELQDACLMYSSGVQKARTTLRIIA